MSTTDENSKVAIDNREQEIVLLEEVTTLSRNDVTNTLEQEEIKDEAEKKYTDEILDSQNEQADEFVYDQTSTFTDETYEIENSTFEEKTYETYENEEEYESVIENSEVIEINEESAYENSTQIVEELTANDDDHIESDDDNKDNINDLNVNRDNENKGTYVCIIKQIKNDNNG